MTYKIYAIRVFTLKWDESLAFYRDTLEMPVTFHSDEMGWAQFDLGGCSLGLEKMDPSDDESDALVGRFVGCSLEVEDIDASFASLSAKGVEFLGSPEKQPWGGTLAHLKDPDGNVLTLLGGT
jgi:lactoylglutathione lyase